MAGPDPSLASWTLANPDTTFTFDTGVLNGGAQLTGTITNQVNGQGVDTQIEINADQIFGGSTNIIEEGTGDDSVLYLIQVLQLVLV